MDEHSADSNREAGSDYSDADPRVLVAVMKMPRDLEIAREQGWYRIPVKRAPAQIGAEYLAFYHTAAFEQEKWSVRFYAPVRGYRVALRLDLLPDEPDHPRAADPYYRIGIGPLEALPHPIPSRKLRRVTFIYTTLSRLLEAGEINDLWDTGSEEDRLWELFRGPEKVVSGRHYRVGESRRSYYARPDELPAPGALWVERRRVRHVPGWFVPYFAPCPTCDGLPTCLEMVRAALRQVE